MNREKISEALTDLGGSYIDEALRYQKKSNMRRHIGLWLAAACLAIVITFVGVPALFPKAPVVSAYAYGSEEALTPAGAIISTGTIRDTGEMTGHPLMFFLSGSGIESVRFSCKNQLIHFMDWTEQRDEYGNAQNFTVPYGGDESDYYFLLIDWVPSATIRELTDHPDSTIASLPAELREDVIVMEITFADGRTATKAIHVTLQDDGTFFASFDDYRIRESDSFVRRPDSEPVPRELLYGPPKITVTFCDEDQNAVAAQALWYNLADVRYIRVRWVGGTPNTVRICYTPAGTETAEALELLATGTPQDGDSELLFFMEEETRKGLCGHLHAELDYGDTIAASEIFQVLFDPDMPAPAAETETIDDVSKIFDVANAYYADTVFTVEELSLLEHSGTRAVVSALVSRGGIVQEPERTMILEPADGTWVVVSEGY